MNETKKTRTRQADTAPPNAASAASEIVKRNSKRNSKRNAKQHELAPLTPGQLARERVKRYLIQRFYTRFHMSLILVTAGLAAMLTNWLLLRIGIHAMWMRYPVAVTMAYAAFLAGIWLWLRYVNFTQEPKQGRSRIDGDEWEIPAIGSGGGGSGSVEIPNVIRGGGGSFDGGGASGAWSEVQPVAAFAEGSSSAAPDTGNSLGAGFKSIGSKFGDFGDLDGEGVVLIVLALVLVFSVAIASGYVIWFAPDILGEALFGATLAGGLAKSSKRFDEEGWAAGVIKKTWMPFAVVLAVAMVVAIYVGVNHPGASTLGGAVSAAVGS